MPVRSGCLFILESEGVAFIGSCWALIAIALVPILVFKPSVEEVSVSIFYATV